MLRLERDVRGQWSNDEGKQQMSTPTPSCFVAAAVAQHAFLSATVRVALVSELTKLVIHAPVSICKGVRAHG